jgi:hypothetical protein
MTAEQFRKLAFGNVIIDAKTNQAYMVQTVARDAEGGAQFVGVIPAFSVSDAGDFGQLNSSRIELRVEVPGEDKERYYIKDVTV